MSQAYHVRPSELLDVSNGYHGFTVDRAVWSFASAIENDQEIETGRLPKNASATMTSHVRQRVLDRYLGIDQATAKGRFRDPGTASRRR